MPIPCIKRVYRCGGCARFFQSASRCSTTARFDHLREELKWISSELGKARNIDVMIKRASHDDLSRRLQAAREPLAPPKPRCLRCVPAR
ncbi:CHAD domain-containing protein [Sinorhizobium meliloti]|uniref:CHAD domain-containing protein n=1 Tax=Rhizobium meliloti TaxID=382 RepID=UPI001F3B2A6F|nr:CHAD domain-containing protein [Sinorhizobium meliloti]